MSIKTEIIYIRIDAELLLCAIFPLFLFKENEWNAVAPDYVVKEVENEFAWVALLPTSVRL